MLRTTITHPPLLAALGRAGHGSLVAICDANFPFHTAAGPHAEVVYLNFSAGTVDVVTVAKAVADMLPIEEGIVMAPPADGPHADGGSPPVFADMAAAIGTDADGLTKVDRFAFYDLVRSLDTVVVIATGEQRLFGNVIIRVGVIPPPD